MNDDDLFERLGRANPVPPGDTSGRRIDPYADALRNSVVRARPRASRTVRVAVAIAIVLLALAAVVGFALLRHRHATQPARVACYVVPDVSARRIVVRAGGDPAAACTLEWREGRLGTGPAPHFAPCVLRGGALAAFPGEAGTTCARLGLAVFAPSSDAIVHMSTELTSALSQRCDGAEDARAAARNILSTNHLSGWTVEVGTERPFDRTNPCASVHIEPARKHITIVAVPNLRAPAPETPSS